MEWLGLQWDEGPVHAVGGTRTAPKQAALRLLESGHAYHCFCSPELLEQKRKEAAAKKTDFKYDRTCLNLTPRRSPAAPGKGRAGGRTIQGTGRSGVVSAMTSIGEITISSDMIEDFVLLRSNGQPTYHVSVVVDDIDMRITHVIRGADHISNTPKQILLYRALGATIPGLRTSH